MIGSHEKELIIREGRFMGLTLDHWSLEGAGIFYKPSHPVNRPERALFPKNDNR